MNVYSQRFFGGYRLYDEESGFLLNYAGASGFDLDASLRRDRKAISSALDFMRRIEAGRIVNLSEGRRADHFNLRVKSPNVKPESSGVVPSDASRRPPSIVHPSRDCSP